MFPVDGAVQPWRELRSGEVLVKVAASGLNRADLLQRSGDYRPPPGESDVPGLELAGEVLQVGPGGDGSLRVGDRVAALVGSGAHAETCVVQQDLALTIPPDFPLATAAVLPEALATAWWNLCQPSGARPGDHVLVYGANSGVGHIVVQVAAQLGCVPIGGVRGTRWHRDLATLGASPVDTTALDARERILAIAPGGADIVVDLVGAANADLTRSTLARDGRWLVVGLLGGENMTLSLRDVIRRRWHITGSSIRSLSAAEKAAAMGGVRGTIWPAVLAGRIVPRIHRTFPRERIAEAWAEMESGGFFGKMVVTAEACE